MKIYGYSKTNHEDLQEMNEITIQGSYDELINGANFILKYAKLIKESGDTFEHAHIQDEYKDCKQINPDIVIHK